MRATTKFRELMEREKCLGMPGVYDCFSARIVEKMGFASLYVTGYGIEATKLGRPDLGLSGMSEVTDHAGNICDSVDVPVICDSDVGWGGVLNVMRTVRAFEKAGVAGIHIEDQGMPKKCGGLDGRKNITLDEMVGKIKAAKEAITDPDFVFIARSDAKVYGIDEIKRRLEAYLDAGADLVMVGERYTVDELRDLANTFRGKLMVCGGFHNCEEMNLSLDEYAEMGVKVVAYALVGLGAAAKAIKEAYQPLLTNRVITNEELFALCMDIVSMNRQLDIKKYLNYESMYTPIV